MGISSAGYASEPPHLGTIVVRPGGGTCYIDEVIAPLIRACWAKGIETVACCQEASPGMAMIGFASLDDMERMYAALDSGGNDTIFEWGWHLYADGGLRAELHFPVSRATWAAEQLESWDPE